MYKRAVPPPSSSDGHATSTPRLQGSSASNRVPEAVIVMSGYLTKRTRSVVRWKRRWWQLLGNGTLLYFKNADRHKMLGEIDIAHSCYDVRLGADGCAMTFPRFTGPQCCFSFAILKRTYYVYAPTPAEAKRWTESLTSTSYLLNRNRPQESNTNPAVWVAAPTLSQPAQPHPPTPPSPKPPVVFVRESSSSPEDEEASPTLYSLSQVLMHPSYHYSVPDLRFDEPSSFSQGHPGLWLDGSPRKKQPQGWPLQRERALSQLTLANTYSSHQRDPEARRATISSMQSRPAKRTSTGYPFCDIPEHEELDSDAAAMGGTLPRQSKAKRPSSSLNMVDLTLGSSCERLEQLQEREDAIRQKLRELEQRSKAYSKKAASFPRRVQPLATSSHQPTVLPSMVTETHYSSPDGQSSSMQRSHSSSLSKSLERKPKNQPKKSSKTPSKTPPKMKQTPTPGHVEGMAQLNSYEGATARDDAEWEKNAPPSPQEAGQFPDQVDLTSSPIGDGVIPKPSTLPVSKSLEQSPKNRPEPPRTPPKTTPKTKQMQTLSHVRGTSLLNGNKEATARDDVDWERNEPQSPQEAERFADQTDLMSSPISNGVTPKPSAMPLSRSWEPSPKSQPMSPKTPPKTPPKPSKMKRTPAHVEDLFPLNSNEEMTTKDNVDQEKNEARLPQKARQFPDQTVMTSSPVRDGMTPKPSASPPLSKSFEQSPKNQPKLPRTPPETPPKHPKTRQMQTTAHMEGISPLNSNEEMAARDDVDQEKSEAQSPQKARQFPDQTTMTSSPVRNGVTPKPSASPPLSKSFEQSSNNQPESPRTPPEMLPKHPKMRQMQTTAHMEGISPLNSNEEVAARDNVDREKSEAQSPWKAGQFLDQIVMTSSPVRDGVTPKPSSSPPLSKSFEQSPKNQPKSPRTPPKTPPKPPKMRQMQTPAHMEGISPLNSNEEMTARGDVDQEKNEEAQSLQEGKQFPDQTVMTSSPVRDGVTPKPSTSPPLSKSFEQSPNNWPKSPKTPPKTPPKPPKTKRMQTPARVEGISPLRSSEETTARDDVDWEKNEPQSPQEAGQFPDQTVTTTSPIRHGVAHKRGSPFKDGMTYKQTTRLWGVPTKYSVIRAQQANKWTKSEIRKLIAEVKRAGHVGSDGRLQVTSGKLLEHSEIKLETLLETLLLARKHEVVQFEGDVLFNGQNDDTTITLMLPDF